MLMGAGECMIELLRKGINVVRRIGWRSEANFKNICNHIGGVRLAGTHETTVHVNNVFRQNNIFLSQQSAGTVF